VVWSHNTNRVSGFRDIKTSNIWRFTVT